MVCSFSGAFLMSSTHCCHSVLPSVAVLARVAAQADDALRKFTSPEGGSPERGLHGDFVLRLLRKAVTVCIHGLGMHKRDEVAHVQRDFARA